MSHDLDEGLFLKVGGLDHWVTIRGRYRANPVLLVLSGAGVAFSPMAPVFASWEASFTLVQWDQPQAGATLSRNGADPEPLTYARLARDGLAVSEAICARLGVSKIAVLALSAGSVVGLKMIRARPDLFFAYVANGQVTNWARQEQLSYRMILERAQASGNGAAVEELEALGPPPWPGVAADLVKSRYANAMTPAEQSAIDPATMAKVRSPPAGASWVADVAPSPDPQAAGLAAFAALKPELAAFDALELGCDYRVPMVFLQGAQDAHTPAVEVAAYAAALSAPSVHLELIEAGGHMSIFLVAEMKALLEAYVRPLAPI